MKHLLILAMSFSLFSFAETKAPAKKKFWTPGPIALVASAPVKTKTAAAVPLVATSASLTSVMARLDIKPSWFQAENKWVGQYEAEMGIRSGSGFQLSYVQEFLQKEMSQFGLSDGYLRLQVPEIFQSKDGLKFGYEARVYAPTDPIKASQGMITAFRNYFMLSQRVTDAMSLFIWEVPILHVYSQSGFDAPTPEANPIFENRVYMGTSLSLFNKSVSVFLPLVFAQKRYSFFKDEDTLHSDDWQHAVLFAPEILWQLYPGVQVGAFYESGNLIAPDFLSLDGSAFQAGKIQGVLRLSF